MVCADVSAIVTPTPSLSIQDLGRLVDIHHHGPPKVRHGAGNCVQALIVAMARTA
jgi:hypothetical protein